MKIGINRTLRNVGAEARGLMVTATGGGPSSDGPYKIFVVGSGRSGTHWLGHMLGAFASTHVTIEKAPIFPWVVEIARNPEREDEVFPKLARRYRAEHRKVLPRHYVDKSHPNLWLAERLADEFPEARFVAIWRTLESTVASMLVHDGVRRWVEIWDRAPTPSRFLGVTEELMPAYREMSIPARCAVRVITHAREIDRLDGELGDRIHVVNYERLFAAPQQEARRLAAFLHLPAPADMPLPNQVSRSKWRSQLSKSDHADIRDVAAMMGAEHLLDTLRAA